MSKQYDNEKRLVLFPNDKGGNDKRPDYRGSLTLNGVEWKLSVWRKSGQKGEFLSGQMELPQPKQAAASAPASRPTSSPAPAAQPAKTAANVDEDVPF